MLDGKIKCFPWIHSYFLVFVALPFIYFSLRQFVKEILMKQNGSRKMLEHFFHSASIGAWITAFSFATIAFSPSDEWDSRSLAVERMCFFTDSSRIEKCASTFALIHFIIRIQPGGCALCAVYNFDEYDRWTHRTILGKPSSLHQHDTCSSTT